MVLGFGPQSATRHETRGRCIQSTVGVQPSALREKIEWSAFRQKTTRKLANQRDQPVPPCLEDYPVCTDRDRKVVRFGRGDRLEGNQIAEKLSDKR